MYWGVEIYSDTVGFGWMGEFLSPCRRAIGKSNALVSS